MIDQKLKNYDKIPYRREAPPKGKGEDGGGTKGKAKGRGAKESAG